ncbi:MAG: DUF6265 family protein [Erythrobacter sp.]
MRLISTFAALAVLCACTGPAVADQTKEGIMQLTFLEGDWESNTNGSWSEEHWSDAKGGMMIGTGRSGEADALQSFEFLRIVTEEDGTIAYYAAPGGGEPTRFTLVQAGENAATFANPDHDFPQRISYRRKGDAMVVEISLADGGNAIGWELQLAD